MSAPTFVIFVENEYGQTVADVSVYNGCYFRAPNVGEDVTIDFRTYVVKRICTDIRSDQTRITVTLERN